MICNLANRTKVKTYWTEEIRPIYREKFVMRGMSFEFIKAARLRYLEKKMANFGVLSLEAQDVFLKRSSSPAVCRE